MPGPRGRTVGVPFGRIYPSRVNLAWVGALGRNRDYPVGWHSLGQEDPRPVAGKSLKGNFLPVRAFFAFEAQGVLRVYRHESFVGQEISAAYQNARLVARLTQMQYGTSSRPGHPMIRKARTSTTQVRAATVASETAEPVRACGT